MKGSRLLLDQDTMSYMWLETVFVGLRLPSAYCLLLTGLNWMLHAGANGDETVGPTPQYLNLGAIWIQGFALSCWFNGG